MARAKQRLDWPLDRPRTPPEGRALGRFGVPLAAAHADLLDELRRLGAEGVAVTHDPAAWREPSPFAARPKGADPGVAVWFGLGGRRLCFTCDRWLDIRDNLRAVGLMVAAIRGIDRWGAAGSAAAAFAGFAALPAGGSPDWRETLGLGGEPTAEEVDRAYRRLAKAAHPDAGGDPERFRELAAAYERARREVAA